jgi:transcriptional regulator of heat shock response
MIGSQNPFGNMCSALVTEYHLNKDRGVFGLLGPMRMDYEANLGLVNYVRELINKI